MNRGQNRGKFNQLKSLLQNTERIQTSDDIAMARSGKQVFFDDKTVRAVRHQYGMTGFPDQFKPINKLKAALNKSEALHATDTSMNASHGREFLFEKQQQEMLLASYDQHQKMIAVQENDSLHLGPLNYTDEVNGSGVEQSLDRSFISASGS